MGSVFHPREKEVKEKLISDNPPLSPDKLSQHFAEYTQFERNFDHLGVWNKPDLHDQINQAKKKHSKILLLLSGVSGGGKDNIRETIVKLYPEHLFRVITATSRSPREGEEHKKDYYFYESPDKFRQAVDEQDFIEWVEQGERLYGLPKISIADALQQNSPLVVSHVEMSAWPHVDKFIQEEIDDKPFVLKAFVLPNVRYQKYENWLEKNREDVPARITRTIWELDEAPKSSDIIISNFDIDNPNAPFLEWHSQSLLNLLWQVLKPELVPAAKDMS